MATVDSARVRKTDTNGFTHAKAHGQNALDSWTSSSSSIGWNLPPTLPKGRLELSNIPLFSKLPAEELRLISAHGVARTYPKNTILLHEKDSNGSLYVILRGRVKLYVSSENGKEIVLNVYGPGDYFGELELIDSGPCATSVMTLEHSHICMISKAGFQRYLFGHPARALELLHSLARRVRLLIERVKSLALNNVYGRVAHTLLRLATEQDGQFVIEQRLTQQDLANRVGTSREMVSRILQDLRAGGYLKVKDRRITIQRKLPSAW